jgi:nucleoside-diphosphate-sugar epimerase
MKIFVTGGTGFIGSHLLRQLGATEHQIVALRRDGSRPSIELPREPTWLSKPMDQLEPADLAGCDALVHLASVGISPRVAPWSELFQWNVLVQLQLMQAAKQAGVRRVVISGSFAEYGRSADRHEFIPTDAALLPTSAYAASKAAGFIAASAFATENLMELCYLRIFSAFGEGQHAANFWPALRDAALRGDDFAMTAGEQIRDYIPVGQVAAAVLDAAQRTDVRPGEPLVKNVASGKPVSMRAFAEHWWAAWNASGSLRIGAKPYRPNEPMRFVPEL